MMLILSSRSGSAEMLREDASPSASSSSSSQEALCHHLAIFEALCFSEDLFKSFFFQCFIESHFKKSPEPKWEGEKGEAELLQGSGRGASTHG